MVAQSLPPPNAAPAIFRHHGLKLAIEAIGTVDGAVDISLAEDLFSGREAGVVKLGCHGDLLGDLLAVIGDSITGSGAGPVDARLRPAYNIRR